MHWYQYALLAGAILVGCLAWNVPRAVAWVGLGGLAFVASSWWHDAGLPNGAAFGASLNLLICLLLYIHAEQRWEMRVWNAFHLMIVIDILYMLDLIGTHYAFALSLELANWAALLVIGATGALERIRDHGWVPDGGHPHWAGRLHRALHEKRALPVFWERP